MRACPAFAEALSRVKRKSKGICFCELSTAFRASREVGRIRIRVRLQAYRKDVPYRSRARRSPLGVSTTGDVHPSRDPSLRDVILALSRAKGKDLCIRAQRSQWQRTRLGIRLQPCRKPGNPTIASTHPSHLSLPPDVILSADSVLPRKTESSEGSMHSRSTEPVVEDSYQGTPSGVP